MAATDKVGHRMPRHHHLHSDSDAAVGDARPPPPPDGEVVEGVGVVCFVGDRWWQVRTTRLARSVASRRSVPTADRLFWRPTDRAGPLGRTGRERQPHCADAARRGCVGAQYTWAARCRA